MRLLTFVLLAAAAGRSYCLTLTSEHSDSTQDCDEQSAAYDAKACLMRSLGMSMTKLNVSVSSSTAAVHLMRSAGCSKMMKIFTIPEIEELFPSLKGCHLTTYAGFLQAAIQHEPCQVKKISQADVIFMPPYLAKECNWPSYGKGLCFSEANMLRPGKICRQEPLEAVAKLQEEHGKPVVVVDMSSFQGIDGLEKKNVWVKLNLQKSRYRAGHTISQAPPPFLPRCQLCSRRADLCYSGGLDRKQYVLTFKGSIKRNKIRSRVRHLFHSPSDKRIIVDNNDTRWDYDDLLHASKFVLILKGDADFSYRFTEAVCSGGVPVLVTSSWVPPFNEVKSFASYGIQMRESEVDKLLEVLSKYSAEDLEKLRKEARHACETMFMSVSLQAKAMVQNVLSIV
mmetsp:Transcript_99450/g.186859  ORF Transcript_99450/g.186859 Transcript_99450/m.186859 type:complete len:396 (+) Transcript_99450:150-1337(+)